LTPQKARMRNTCVITFDLPAMKSLLFLCTALVVASSSAFAATAARPPNIVFILCDDLGINDLHCYGRKDHATPNLDRLASQGTRFTAAYCAQPICSPFAADKR
jgi:arylsulfatase A